MFLSAGDSLALSNLVYSISQEIKPHYNLNMPSKKGPGLRSP